MKALIAIVLILLNIPSALRAQELGDLRWQYHILLLMDPNGSPRCEDQLNSLRAHTKTMLEHDLLLFVFNGRVLLDQHGEKSPLGVKEIPSPVFEGVILIGKDGGVKLKKPFPVAPADIFKRIDTMVVRRGEKRG